MPVNLRGFCRHLLIKARGANNALQLALSYLKMKGGETEVEETEPSSGFRSYLNDLARLVLENAEELRESRSIRRKQPLCVVVDFINNEGLAAFKSLRSEENILKGSKPLKWLLEASEDVFEQRG